VTEAGRLFLQEARDIIARADHAAVMARRMGSATARQLRVGMGFCTDQLDIAALLDGQLDVGFVRPPVDDAALNSEIVISEPFVVALPATHHFASRPRLELSALANEPFVLPPRDAVPMFHEAVLRACREAGFVPHAPDEVDHLQMVLRMVAAGAGVALVPASARKDNQDRVIYRALRPSPAPLQTAVAWRREDASATLAEFISVARRSLHHLRE
jgi:DNA-binding transcriptional LysR family regulator